MFGTNELNFSILAIAGTIFILWIIALLADNFEYEDKIQRITGNCCRISFRNQRAVFSQHVHNSKSW